MRRLVAAVVLSVLLAVPALPQFELGSIIGLVTDPSKAPLTGATVEIRSLTTNVRRQVLTTSSGEYSSLPLQPDRNEVLVRAPGFRDSASEVTLTVKPAAAGPISPWNSEPSPNVSTSSHLRQ